MDSFYGLFPNGASNLKISLSSILMSKITVLLSFCTLLLVLFSCGEKKEEKVITPVQKYNPFVLRLQHFGNRTEMKPSFPLWFDDSIVKALGVKQITRRMISLNDPEDTLDNEISEEHIYRFNKDGVIDQWQVRSFYDNICFESVTLNYDCINTPSKGYCIIKKMKFEHFNGGMQSESMTEHHIIESNDRFEIFGEKSVSKELMFMKDSAYWGSISIDTVLHPDPEDVIVLGTPIEPHRQFQVENTVKQFNVVEYNYSKNGMLTAMLQENYPFITKRHIRYGKDGNCEGFVDSIFIDDKYLSKKEYRFSLEKGGIPVELNRWIEEGDTKTKIEQETFIYEYFERD